MKIKGAASVSKILKSLKKGKTYYVRLHSYKTLDGTNYFSEWSAKKTVKVKK